VRAGAQAQQHGRTWASVGPKKKTKKKSDWDAKFLFALISQELLLTGGTMEASYVGALRQLKQLYDEGILDEDEFKSEKKLLLKCGRKQAVKQAAAAPQAPQQAAAAPQPPPRTHHSSATPHYMSSSSAASTSHHARATTRQKVERELKIIYGRADPSKVPKIPKLLDQYKGKEEELLDRVRRKYALGMRGAASVKKMTNRNAADYKQEIAGEFADAPSTGLAYAGKKLFLREVASAAAVPKNHELAKIWRRYDYNGNNILSLAEIDKLISQNFQEFNYKPAVMRAYKFADADQSGFIEKQEFVLLIRSLVYFKNLSAKFRNMDSDGDRRIELSEFIDGCSTLELMNGFTGEAKLEHAERMFNEMDSDGGGHVLFNEFCSFLARKKAEAMDLVDGDD
jgi:Ca2+-binding EF-hand superfamily protein